ncbi:MAG: type II toxin-antitoxin system RelE/ParE family toxin [Verrucomicrobia bacterium]|nr:type II toxin-antitoxin system RelE/ParE family toxin [Verrucomicrobiota bacterium]MCH8513777.1 type II toxin-antitoxin system RelE/ParE family toxin [Kiritimatiellia bacterium]
MTYDLKFLPSALKEWKKLGATVKDQFKKKLEERMGEPEVPADRLRGHKNFYKIKLRSSGYRLVYEVEKEEITIYVIAVGKRENKSVYRNADKRKR